MCISSREVKECHATRVFVRRHAATQTQFVAIETVVDDGSDEPLAVVVPVPCTRKPTLIDMSMTPNFFDNMASACAPPPRGRGTARSKSLKRTLDVERVGSYECSFVPTSADMENIDALYRAPTTVMEEYKEGYCFLVFKLSKGRQHHPFAFSFISPLDYVHVPMRRTHEGLFDHVVYIQSLEPPTLTIGEDVFQATRETDNGEFRVRSSATTILNQYYPIWRVVLKGDYANTDASVTS